MYSQCKGGQFGEADGWKSIPSGEVPMQCELYRSSVVMCVLFCCVYFLFFCFCVGYCIVLCRSKFSSSFVQSGRTSYGCFGEPYILVLLAFAMLMAVQITGIAI